MPSGRLPAIGRVLGYWRAERRTIRHGLVSLVVSSVGEIAAGVALGAMTGTLDRLPGLLVLLPAANSIRGSIFGGVSSRLGTSIHTGMFERTRKREGALYQNIVAAGVLTLSVSFMIGFAARAVAAAVGVESIGIVDLIVISVLGGAMSSVVVGVLAVVLALVAHSYDWDLDSVATPAITAIGDMVTIPALYAATFAAQIRYVTPAVLVVIAAATVTATLLGLRSRLPQTRRAIRESLPVLVATGTLSLLAGVLIESRIERFIAFPAFLVMIPALMSDTGALASSLTARLASKLHLGALEPKSFPQGLALLDSSIFLLFGFLVFAFLAMVAHFAAQAIGLPSPGLGSMIEVGVLAGITTTLALVVLAYYVAIATYRLGLDPDNHGVPVVTSASDLASIVALIITLVALGLA